MKVLSFNYFIFMRILVLSAFLAIFSGCAGKTATNGPVFFPPAPDEPHIQYLMGINDSTDIEGKPSSFSMIVTGSGRTNVLKRLGKAYGVTAHKGKLYICSLFGKNVVVLDIIKKSFEYLPGGEDGPGKLRKPVNITLDENDNMYVTDTARREVVVFNSAGNFVRTLPKIFGSAKESNIVSLLAYDGKLYAVDAKSNEIRVIDPKSGEQIGTLGRSDDAEKSVGIPIDIAVDKKGSFYFTNMGRANVMKFDRDGNHLMTFGRAGDSFGEFTRPKGIAVDDEGRIYVVDNGFSNVQIFNEQGRILGFFGNPGLPAGSLNAPTGIAVTKDNLEYFQKLAAPGFKLENVIFVVNQENTAINPFVSVYGIGEMKK